MEEDDNMNVKILIAYHKQSELIKSEKYVPIQVGREISLQANKDGKISKNEHNWLFHNLIGDNTGDNISKLNRYFNEMTAIYWGWKNQADLENPEYLGLMHYRRHFIFNQDIKIPEFTWLKNSNVYSYEYIDGKYKKEVLDEQSLENLLSQYDILCSKAYDANNLNDGHYYRNCRERFIEVARVDGKWYDKMCDIVFNDYSEYANELIYLNKHPKHYLCNMFVMRKDLYNKYCEFIFDVLFRLYEEFKLEKVDLWQARAIGFLAEFLTSIFISTYRIHNPKKVKELDLTYVEHPEERGLIRRFCDNIYSRHRYSGYKSKVIFGKKKLKKLNNINEFNLIKVQNERILKTLEEEDVNLNNNLLIKNLVSEIHPETFGGFKGKFAGKDVVLCATGPTFNKFKKIEDAIYIGVNRAFLNENISLDFLFIQDYLKKDNIHTLANNYKKGYCVKFYGRISDMRLLDIKPIERIPMSDILNANAREYILENNLNYNFARDLECEAIGDAAGTVFSAMQFALYTHPQRIYLVGCDCSSGYFNEKGSTNNASYQIENWQKIKTFAQQNYPDVEIISINPVGLKGIFKDEYQ